MHSLNNDQAQQQQQWRLKVSKCMTTGNRFTIGKMFMKTNDKKAEMVFWVLLMVPALRCVYVCVSVHAHVCVHVCFCVCVCSGEREEENSFV